MEMIDGGTEQLGLGNLIVGRRRLSPPTGYRPPMQITINFCKA